MKRPFYRAIASALQARINCEKKGNYEWYERHLERIESLVKQHAPSGSGFDDGTAFDADESKPERLVFRLSFHHMDASGSYCGWTEHSVIVRASLVFGHDIRVTGKDRNRIREYITEQFSALGELQVGE